MKSYINIEISIEELKQLISKVVQSELKNFAHQKNNESNDIYLTRKQTAELLHVSLTTLNEWSRKRILRPLKMGNRTYYKKSDIFKKLERSNQF